MFSSARCTYLILAAPAVLLVIFVGTRSILVAQVSDQDVHIVPHQSHRDIEANPSDPALGSHGPFFKSDASLVLVPVSVTDALNRNVIGLNMSNFRVYEDKKLQTVLTVSSEDAPVSIGIILDTSASMTTKAEPTRQAVMEFIKNANQADEFFLITFSDKPTEKVDFTGSAELIQEQLAYWVPKGRTALLDAVYLGISKMRAAKYPRKALLVISDGGDNHSRYTQHELKSLIKESDVMIFAIGIYDHYFSTMEEEMGPLLLEDVAALSGGSAFAIDNPNDLSIAAATIGHSLRNLYVLSYHPNATHDGKWHRIKVALSMPKGFPRFLVHAKQGYYTPPD